jgi:hypothetical protein
MKQKKPQPSFKKKDSNKLTPKCAVRTRKHPDGTLFLVQNKINECII